MFLCNYSLMTEKHSKVFRQAIKKIWKVLGLNSPFWLCYFCTSLNQIILYKHASWCSISFIIYFSQKYCIGILLSNSNSLYKIRSTADFGKETWQRRHKMIYCLISYANMTHLLEVLYFNVGSFLEDHPSKDGCFYLHLCNIHNTYCAKKCGRMICWIMLQFTLILNHDVSAIWQFRTRTNNPPFTTNTNGRQVFSAFKQHIYILYAQQRHDIALLANTFWN